MIWQWSNLQLMPFITAPAIVSFTTPYINIGIIVRQGLKDKLLSHCTDECKQGQKCVVC